MALEAVVFPQDLFGCAMRELFSFGEESSSWCYDFGQEEREWDMGLPILPSSSTTQLYVSTTENASGGVAQEEKAATTTTTATATATAIATGRKKRRRIRCCKNKEEVENQRMTHIAVERNRRKLMNEYLAVLRSIMPSSYVQRADQASIVGGAINYVKELEQLLQSLEAQRNSKLGSHSAGGSSSSSPFSDFFTFPQYSSTSSHCSNASTNNINANETMAKNHSAVADIEVTMVERHANLRVLTKRRPKQLLTMVVALQNLLLTTLHLNVTTVDQMVLYSFSLKVEDDCQFTSVDEIATAVHHMVGQIDQDEASLI